MIRVVNELQQWYEIGQCNGHKFISFNLLALPVDTILLHQSADDTQDKSIAKL